MNVIVDLGRRTYRLLTGKAVEIEGSRESRKRKTRSGHDLRDCWRHGRGTSVFLDRHRQRQCVSDYVTMVLGSVTVVGAARLLVARWRLADFTRGIRRPSHLELDE